jgi:hypothetical protein
VASSHVGKLSDKWSSYLAAYSKVLSNLNINVEAVFEIGVQRGGSLEIWAELLPGSVIVGCDIDPACGQLQFNGQVEVIVGDATSRATSQKVKAIAPNFGVIVDDGSHVSADIILSLARYLPSLSPGGAYVIEDLHASYWPSWGGGLLEPLSAMSFLKKLTDLLNSEHWIDPVRPLDLIDGYLPSLSRSEKEAFVGALQNVASLEFRDSLCVIQTFEVRPPSRLGNRVELGAPSGPSESTMDPRDFQLTSSPPPVLPRSTVRRRSNPIAEKAVWGLEHEITMLNEELNSSRKQLSSAKNELRAKEAELRSILESRSWRLSRVLARLLGRQ